MTHVRTVALPTRVLKRWDCLAAAQLCEHAAELAEENDQLRRELSDTEDRAEHWHANTLELAGEGACLTIEGLLRVRQQVD